MASPEKPPHHVRPHPSETHHSKFHESLLCRCHRPVVVVSKLHLLARSRSIAAVTFSLSPKNLCSRHEEILSCCSRPPRPFLFDLLVRFYVALGLNLLDLVTDAQ